MNKSRVEPYKFAVLIGLLGIALYETITGSIVEDYIFERNGEKSLVTSGNYRYIITMAGFYVGIIFLWNTYKIFQMSQKSTKKYAQLNFIGSLIFAPGVILSFIFGLTLFIPAINAIIASIGILLSSYAIYRSPQLIFILSFHVYKLSVIQGDTGIALYNFNWETTEKSKSIDDDMYTSIFSGIKAYSESILNAGLPLEISYERGSLLIHHSIESNLFFVLYTSDTTSLLREGLNTFSQKFSQEFHSEIDDMGNSNVFSERFNHADKITKDIFSFVP